MQAQSSSIQGGMIGNFVSIYQQEGARGLWKVSSQNASSWPGASALSAFFGFIFPISIILFSPNGVSEEERHVPLKEYSSLTSLPVKWGSKEYVMI